MFLTDTLLLLLSGIGLFHRVHCGREKIRVFSLNSYGTTLHCEIVNTLYCRERSFFTWFISKEKPERMGHRIVKFDWNALRAEMANRLLPSQILVLYYWWVYCWWLSLLECSLRPNLGSWAKNGMSFEQSCLWKGDSPTQGPCINISYFTLG